METAPMTPQAAESESPYKMTISLNVLNHLGISLYSNVPAVLSEVVANAYDADADKVKIDILPETDQIVIFDDGHGMNLEDINRRYLHVGYQKRKDAEIPELTPKHRRAPMGRKGIGKLSVFSIAGVVEVASLKDGEKNAFRMVAKEIENKIKEQSQDVNNPIDYRPTPIEFPAVPFPETGTRIVLSKLKQNLKASASFSRKRLARRFSVIGDSFKIIINGVEISIADRDFFSKLEFVWFLGEESRAQFSPDCVNATRTEVIDNEIPYGVGDARYKVTGWVGTFKEQLNIDVEQDNNSIVLMARGKLVMEDVAPEFKEGRVFSKYICGEINADFLDDNLQEDIVTSDRQRILETDVRWEVLKDYIKTKILTPIGNKWTAWRTDNAVAEARKTPAINDWFNALKGDNRKTAEKLFQRIESLKSTVPEVKKELYRSGILAFEKLALAESLSVLEKMSNDEDFTEIIKVFARVDELEATHYYHITKGRLEVLEKFKNLFNPETKERILQDYIFKHLWLLNPTWERAAFDPHMETTINSLFEAEVAKEAALDKEEALGRVDIKYRTVTGKHIIIELKKYDVRVKIHTLMDQVSKYRRTLEKCLNTQFPADSHNIEVICVLGHPPTPANEDKRNREKLATESARYITYDQLLDESMTAYKDYLEKQKDVSRVIHLLAQI